MNFKSFFEGFFFGCGIFLMVKGFKDTAKGIEEDNFDGVKRGVFKILRSTIFIIVMFAVEMIYVLLATVI